MNEELIYKRIYNFYYDASQDTPEWVLIKNNSIYFTGFFDYLDDLEEFSTEWVTNYFITAFKYFRDESTLQDNADFYMYRDAKFDLSGRIIEDAAYRFYYKGDTCLMTDVIEKSSGIGVRDMLQFKFGAEGQILNNHYLNSTFDINVTYTKINGCTRLNTIKSYDEVDSFSYNDNGRPKRIWTTKRNYIFLQDLKWII